MEFWDRGADRFDAIYSGAKPRWERLLDRWFRRDMQERFQWILGQAGNLKGKSVCDLGCGSGRYVVACARSGASRVVGVDAAPGMLRLASSLVAEEGVGERCELCQLDFLQTPLHEIFDVTLAVGVLDYMRDPLLFLQSARSITGSRFLATFPRRWTWRMPLRKLRLAVLGCQVYFYSRQDVVAFLHDAGFHCERIERVGALFCVRARPHGKLHQATKDTVA